jgi:hypothetical protein
MTLPRQLFRHSPRSIYSSNAALIGSPAEVCSRIFASCTCNPGSASSTYFRPPPASRIRPRAAHRQFFLPSNSTTVQVIVLRDIPLNSDQRLFPTRP